MMLSLARGLSQPYLGLASENHERTNGLCLCAPANAIGIVLINRDGRTARIARFLIPFVSFTLHSCGEAHPSALESGGRVRRAVYGPRSVSLKQEPRRVHSAPQLWSTGSMVPVSTLRSHSTSVVQPRLPGRQGVASCQDGGRYRPRFAAAQRARFS
jgi:hypothetical protein